MSRIIVGNPGGGLTVPEEIIQAAGLTGEPVEVEIKDGGIFLRRQDSEGEAKARIDAALKRMFELSKTASLGGLSIRELRDEGRR